MEGLSVKVSLVWRDLCAWQAAQTTKRPPLCAARALDSATLMEGGRLGGVGSTPSGKGDTGVEQSSIISGTPDDA